MLTAYPYPQYRQICEEMGAEYFFDKSTEFHRVQEVLTELAGGAQQTLPGMSNVVTSIKKLLMFLREKGSLNIMRLSL